MQGRRPRAPKKTPREPRCERGVLLGALSIICAALLIACGCGFYGRRGEWKDVTEPVEPAPLFSDGTTDVLYDELYLYRLGNGDVVDLQVAGHEEFSGEVGVDQRGRTAVPNTDAILEVGGLSLEEAEARIAATIAPFVLGRPEVTASLLESQSKYYYVLGGVKYPGVYSMGARIVRLREALARTGFFREFQADKRRVGVITPDPKRPTYLITNGRAILMGKDEQNVILKPGDVVFVQNRIIYDIDRFLYELFITTENVATTHDAVKFWEDAEDGEIGDFTAPSRGVTIIY